MMITKVLEIRDRATFISALATKLVPSSMEEHFHLRRNGFGSGHDVLLSRLRSGEGSVDPYDWGGGTRTVTVAHDYIIKNFDSLKDGDVVDVEFILGETDFPKISERLVML